MYRSSCRRVTVRPVTASRRQQHLVCFIHPTCSDDHSCVLRQKTNKQTKTQNLTRLLAPWIQSRSWMGIDSCIVHSQNATLDTAWPVFFCCCCVLLVCDAPPLRHRRHRFLLFFFFVYAPAGLSRSCCTCGTCARSITRQISSRVLQGSWPPRSTFLRWCCGTC